MIRKEGKQWCLYSKDGSEKLGCHSSKAQAKSQESAVNISKAKAAGHKIPKPKKQGGPITEPPMATRKPPKRAARKK